MEKNTCINCEHFDTYCQAPVPAWAVLDLGDMSGAWTCAESVDADECPTFVEKTVTSRYE